MRLEALSSVVIVTENSPDPVPRVGHAAACPLVCKTRPNSETSFLLCQGIKSCFYQELDMISLVAMVGIEGNDVPFKIGCGRDGSSRGQQASA
jgi:hypothetical protein